MDRGRFVLPQAGWDANSALERYNGAHDPEIRAGGAFVGRTFVDSGFPRESGYPRGAFHSDILIEREGFQLAPPVLGLWPPARRRTLEEELAVIRGAPQHEKVGFVDSYREFDNFRSIREIDHFQDFNTFRPEIDRYDDIDKYREVDGGFQGYRFERKGRLSAQDRDSFDGDDFDYGRPILQDSREGSLDGDYEYSRHADYDSDHQRGRRERDRRRQKERDREKSRRSRDRDRSEERDRSRERSHSYSYDGHGGRSRSPRNHGRRKRERSHSEARQEETRNEKKRERDEKRHQERAPVAPSATLVVKGLSQKTAEDDLYQALTEWGPLRHVRVIKEKGSGISRGFAFIDFPSVEAAKKMIDGIGEDGLVVDGRRLFFEYSSKPTGGLGAPQAVPAGPAQSSPGASKSGGAAAVDWMCTVCGCVNFARRTSCFQCNEGRTEDAPAADVNAATPAPAGKKGSEAGPTHVLVVRGLDEHVNEEALHYEFSKYAPIKDLRLVRDKFTHVSRGFAFVHFHSVEDATKALESCNGTTLEKNGQVLRVAYAKSIHGPGSSSSNTVTSQASSLAAAAIEAATFAQQYDAVGWAPKEYNPNQDTRGTQQGMNGSDPSGTGAQGSTPGKGAADGSSVEAPQSGFVWDEASGYYYDAASGFYYDGHRGLYYDGNHGIWYSYNSETQQYVPYVEAADDAVGTENTAGRVCGDTRNEKRIDKAMDGSSNSKAVISAPAATIHVEHATTEKKRTVAETAVAAQSAGKKEKEKMKEKEKEVRFASKSLLLASKKKNSNVMTMWKQRQHEGQAVRMVVDEGPSTTTINSTLDDKHDVVAVSATAGVGLTSSQVIMPSKKIEGIIHTKGGSGRGSNTVGGVAGNPFGGNYHPSESMTRVRQDTSSIISTIAGLGRGTGRGTPRLEPVISGAGAQPAATDLKLSATPFKTDSSALGTYGPMAGARRRFTEAPQSAYRDRAAERSRLYGSSLPGDTVADLDFKDRGGEMPFPPGSGGRGRGNMPFPPGVGTKLAISASGSVLAGPEVQDYEVSASEKAIDERNVGNRMLRNMGWQEGSGLGKDGTGIVDPVHAQATQERAGLGSQSHHRNADARFETQPGDSYQTVIQRKAFARFHEM